MSKGLPRTLRQAQLKENAKTPETDVGLAASGIVCVEQGLGPVRKTILRLNAFSVATVDHTTDGASGSAKLYDFPEGAITILGAVVNLTTLKSGSGLAATAALVHALGTVAANADDDLADAGEGDIIASTAGTLSSSAGSFKAHRSAAPAVFDGHTTAVDLRLNVAVVDAGTSANAAVLYTGTVEVTWLNAGDYT